MDREFLEDYPLFKKYKFNGVLHGDSDSWEVVPINMHCPTCLSNQTFAMSNDYSYHHGARRTYLADKVVDLLYTCQSCKRFERRFLIHIGSDLQTVYKAGQYPAWEIKIDKNIEVALGKHADNFKKGLVCESQGYGIGAFSYYRRITEDIIDELLDSISNLIEPEHKDEYGEALAKTKKTRVTQDKIDLVKELLPAILKPDGVNPLGVLHSELSAGLHAATDESCLETASQIKTILFFLVETILRSRESARSFTASMKSLLDKKSGKSA